MVPRAIPDENGVISPVLVLQVQPQEELVHEELHRVRIRVGLEEADVNLAVGVHGCNHGDPGPHSLYWYGVAHALLLPDSPPEI